MIFHVFPILRFFAIFFAAACLHAAVPISEPVPLSGETLCYGGSFTLSGGTVTLTIAPDAIAADVFFMLKPCDIRIFDKLCFRVLSSTPGVGNVSVLLLGENNKPYAERGFPATAGTVGVVSLPDPGSGKIPFKLRIRATYNKTYTPKPGETRTVSVTGFSFETNPELLPRTLPMDEYANLNLPADLRGERSALINAYAKDRIALDTEMNPERRKELAANLYAMKSDGIRQFERSVLKHFAGTRQFAWGCTGGIDKIDRDGVFPGELMSSLKIECARNEFEAAQLALYSLRARSNVSVRCSVLESTAPDGVKHTLPPVSAVPVGYVRNAPQVYYRRHDSYYPDPLLTGLKEFDLSKELYQPIWVEIFVPENQAPGVYRGVAEVCEKGIPFLQIPLEVKVWNFAIPKRRSYPVAVVSPFRRTTINSEFAQMYAKEESVLKEANKYLFAEPAVPLESLSPAARRYARIAVEAETMFRAHGLPSDNFYRSVRAPVPARLRLQHREEGSLFSFGNYDSHVCDLLRPQVAAARKEGTISLGYVYGFDEARGDVLMNLNKTFGKIKAEFPDVKTMTTAWDFTCGDLHENWRVTDIWVLPTFRYIELPENVAKAKKRGQRVWWYTCDYPRPPSANVMMESTGVATRGLVGFLSWKYRAEGFLFYASTLWNSSKAYSNLLFNWRKPSGDVRAVSPEPETASHREYQLCSTGTPACLAQKRRVLQTDVSTLRFKTDCLVERFTPAKRSYLELKVRIDYRDKSFDNFYLKADMNRRDWQNLSGSFPLRKPAQYVSTIFFLRSRDASVRIKNAEVSVDHVTTRYAKPMRIPLSGGPVLSMPYTDNTYASWVVPGPDGVLPTLRLKHLRDGLDDYEYYWQLAAALEYSKRDAAPSSVKNDWRKRAANALIVPKELGRSLTEYADRGSVLLHVRATLGGLLEEAASFGWYHPETAGAK